MNLRTAILSMLVMQTGKLEVEFGKSVSPRTSCVETHVSDVAIEARASLRH